MKEYANNVSTTRNSVMDWFLLLIFFYEWIHLSKKTFFKEQDLLHINIGHKNDIIGSKYS